MAAGIQEQFILESGGFSVEVTLTETYEILSNASAVSVGLRVKSAYQTGGQYLSGFVKLDGKSLAVMDSTVSTHNVPIGSVNTWYDVVRSGNAYTDSPWTQEKIVHNVDGSREITLELELRGYGEDGYLRLRVATTRTVRLADIPRASTVAATDANIGAVSNISVIRRVSDYTHSIAYQFGALSGYICGDGTVSNGEVKLTQTNIPFRIPDGCYSQIPNSPTGKCVLTVKTYLGSEQIGNAQTAQFTVTAAKDLCTPDISGKVEDTNAVTVALTGDNNILVRYASNALCTLTATAKNGAAIASKEIGGVEVTEDLRSIPAVETGTVVFRCADSRGYEASATVNKTLIPYVPLTAGVAAARTDPTSGNVNLSVSGICYRGSFGAADNTLSVTCSVNNGAAVTVTAVFDENHYKAETVLSGLDYQKSHTISVTVADRLQTVTKAVSVGKGIPVFDWDEDDFQFHVPVSLGGNPLSNLGSPVTGTDAVNLAAMNAALSGRAPAGHGYGGELPMIQSTGTTAAVFEAVADTFLAAMSAQSAKQVRIDDPSLNTNWNLGTIYKASNDYAVIFAFNYNSQLYVKKKLVTWQPWEYINPPMLAGTEYRTTERWNGRPVYAKLLVWKSSTDMYYTGRYEVPHGITNLDSASLRIAWTTDEWTLPHISNSEALYISGVDSASGSTKLVIKTDGNAVWDAGRTFYFYMKYCKTA